MKKSVLATVITIMFLATDPAFAVSMEYEISFDGPLTGAGSFTWDNDTQLMSNMSWDFGSNTGGVDDATYDWSATLDGGNLSQFVFEIFTMEDTHPYECTATTGSCAVLVEDTFGDFDSAYFEITSSNLRRYSFLRGEEFAAYGIFTTSVMSSASVPAPGSLALLGLGLFGLLFPNRKRS